MSISKSKRVVIEAIKIGYKVDVNGIVSSPRGSIKLSVNTNGYYKFSVPSKLSGVCNRETVRVHQLQAYQKYGDMFLQPRIHVRHLNSNSLDNSYENISLGTPHDNAMDKDAKVRRDVAISASHKNRRFSDSEVCNILKDRNNGLKYKELCVKYNTSKSTLSFLFNNAQYTKKASAGPIG